MQKNFYLMFPVAEQHKDISDFRKILPLTKVTKSNKNKTIVLTDGSKMTLASYKDYIWDICLFHEPLPIKYTIDEEQTAL